MARKKETKATTKKPQSKPRSGCERDVAKSKEGQRKRKGAEIPHNREDPNEDNDARATATDNEESDIESKESKSARESGEEDDDKEEDDEEEEEEGAGIWGAIKKRNEEERSGYEGNDNSQPARGRSGYSMDDVYNPQVTKKPRPGSLSRLTDTSEQGGANTRSADSEIPTRKEIALAKRCQQYERRFVQMTTVLPNCPVINEAITNYVKNLFFSLQKFVTTEEEKEMLITKLMDGLKVAHATRVTWRLFYGPKMMTTFSQRRNEVKQALGKVFKGKYRVALRHW
jgi:hypothetical protein